MPSPLLGLHHVTAITGPAQPTLDFYGGLLGLRLVKRTVNFDDPGTYHLYFADAEARPGSVWTVFPWAADALRGRVGAGQATATAFAVPAGAVDGWLDRLVEAGHTDVGAPTERFGERVLSIRDPDGLGIHLVEADGAEGAWTDGPVDASLALGAFHAVTMCSLAPDATARVLTEAFGYEVHAQDGDRLRLWNPRADRARFVDLFCAPSAETGRMGVGTVHHVAFRAPDDAAQMEARETLLAMGLRPTPPIDRQYFRSVYVREPGGLLFEIATDPPGFAVDEPADALGQSLMLPPQYEPKRAQIEARLPALRMPR